MKITLLTGSPRRGGNSDIMASAFCAAAGELGIELARFDTAFMPLEMCRACDSCFGKKGPCVFDDGFNDICASLMSSQGLVIATPVYWYSLPGKLKCAVDKLYSLCRAEKDLAGKRYALIACCEDDTPEAFTGLRWSLDKSMELLKCEKLGEVLIHGVHKLGDVNGTGGAARAAELAGAFLK